MKIYLAVTAVLFALLTLVHIWRMIVESTSLAHDPWFLVITLISAAFCVWAARLWVAERRRG
jgi:hypothetical protein